MFLRKGYRTELVYALYQIILMLMLVFATRKYLNIFARIWTTMFQILYTIEKEYTFIFNFRSDLLLVKKLEKNRKLLLNESFFFVCMC